jgi:hypothetical protein
LYVKKYQPLPTPGKINSLQGRHPKVLIAPLDWGLGHATRCIPIIKELLNQTCEVIVAAGGPQKALLEAEFPFLTFVEIPGYDIKFDKNRAFTVIRILRSIPKILIRIKQEKAWLRRFFDREKPDIVISDNRYGLVYPGIYCVFITHQLRIKTPFGPSVDRMLQRLNYRFIRRFSCCWIPDVAGDGDLGGGLAGELSHPAKMPAVPYRYIGWLSRFGGGAAGDCAVGVGGDAGAGSYLLVLLSGPEPQRTLLERVILEQAAGCPHPMILVRGLPQGGDRLSGAPQRMIIHDHLPSAELGQVICDAALVIARPGYSTLMDLARLKKRAVVVPTPGQTEQEYLGKRMAMESWAVCMEQQKFSLGAALAAANVFPYRLAAGETAEILPAAIEELLRCC